MRRESEPSIGKTGLLSTDKSLSPADLVPMVQGLRPKGETLKKTFKLTLLILAGILASSPIVGGGAAQSGAPVFGVEDLRQDFMQLRRILEEEHCCLYEYTGKDEFDRMFDERLALIDRPMRYEEFFRIAAPIAAEAGCMHTALWMPGRFFDLGSDDLFPLQVRLIEGRLVVTGTYREALEIPRGSVILEINGVPARTVFDELRAIASGDAHNPYFIETQAEKRFPMFYASVFGFPEKFTVTYTLPGGKKQATADLRPADIGSVRKAVFAHFNAPLPTLEVLEGGKTAVMTLRTFIYYDRVDEFRKFMEASFRRIKEEGIENLILDLRGNDGGDPFCAVILYSYLEKEPAPYFAERYYGRYADLAEPVPIPENRFAGRLLTLLDGRCGSTNGHFCALLDYHGIGRFVGTPSGSTYKCNAGRNTEFRLDKTDLILTIGRGTFAAAVKGMDKASPIMPDFPVRETYRDFLDGRDVYLETALEVIAGASRTGR
jgi:hypothetical protein